MLEKKVVRDGKGTIIGTVTSGFGDGSKVVHDRSGGFMGRTQTSENGDTHYTRDSGGHLVSRDTADPGLLFGRKK
ncbi:MAG: hypothetical protein ACLQOO_01255 [Terriglobia bacterium]